MKKWILIILNPKPESLKLNELNERYPMINWHSYIKGMFEFFNLGEDITDDMPIYSYYFIYYEKIQQFINDVSVNDLINYFEWKFITADFLENYVSGDIVKAKDEFNQKMNEYVFSKLSMEEINELYENPLINKLSEIAQEYSIPLEKRFFKRFQKRDVDDQFLTLENKENRYNYCSATIKNVMSKAVSRYFVQRIFSESAKNEIEEMAKNIKEVMLDRIQKIEWLDDETKEYAIHKLLKMQDRIGYPDEIMDPKKLYQLYENVEVNNYFDILIEESITRIGNFLRLMDRNEWHMVNPFELSAYYDYNNNSINIPAAIVQYPYFSINEQDYIKYGVIGSIIGHEITHGFDFKGRLYDAKGDYNNWWTDNDDKDYIERSQCFIDQYNAISYEKGKYVDGERTLVENIADNGGLTGAYEAWKLSILKNPERAAEHNKKLPGLQNYTMDQLFYIAYGRSECTNEIYYSEGHAPNIARVNGVVSNSKHFAETFNCPPKSSMNPENKCVIW